MTAETAPGRARRARRDGFGERMIRRGVWWAVALHILRDRRFQEKVITGVIAAVALAQLGRANNPRPVRRAIARYSSIGASQELPRARRALEPGQRQAGGGGPVPGA
jgi:hypothetical protein